MNHRSIAPDKYKKSVLNSFLNRSYKNSSNWLIFTKILDRISQMLTNDIIPQKFGNVNEKHSPQQVHTSDQKSEINFLYKNQLTSTYKHEKNSGKL